MSDQDVNNEICNKCEKQINTYYQCQNCSQKFCVECINDQEDINANFPCAEGQNHDFTYIEPQQNEDNQQNEENLNAEDAENPDNPDNQENEGTIPCNNAANGCQFVGTQDQVEEHLTICQFQVQYCQNDGCDFQTMDYSEFQNHLVDCPFQKEKCKHCNESYIREKAEEHKQVCTVLNKQNEENQEEIIDNNYVSPISNQNPENLENQENQDNLENQDNKDNQDNADNLENLENPENKESPDNAENHENPENVENKENHENDENPENPENAENLENPENLENANSPINPESELNPQSQREEDVNNQESPINPESQANPESVVNPETPLNVENQENDDNEENQENQDNQENQEKLENPENNEGEGNKDEQMNNIEPRSSQNQSQIQNHDQENSQNENQNLENPDEQQANPDELNQENLENAENAGNQDNKDNPENIENQVNPEDEGKKNEGENLENLEENNDQINNLENNPEGEFQEDSKNFPRDSQANSQNISKENIQKSVNEENRPNSIEPPQEDSKLNIAGEVVDLANLNETPENLGEGTKLPNGKNKSIMQNIPKEKILNNLKTKSEMKPGKLGTKPDAYQLDRPSDSSGHQISILQSKKKLGSKIGTGESESQGSQNDLPERIGQIVTSQSSDIVTKDELRSILINFSKDIIQSFVSKKGLAKQHEKDNKKRNVEMIDKINEMVDEVNKQKKIVSDVKRKMGDPQNYEEIKKFSTKPGEKRNPYSNKPDVIQLDQKGNDMAKDMLRQFLNQMRTICLESKIVFTEYIKEYIKNEFKLFDKIISMDPANSKYKQGYTNLNGDEFSKRLDNLYKNIERQINEKGHFGQTNIKGSSDFPPQFNSDNDINELANKMQEMEYKLNKLNEMVGIQHHNMNNYPQNNSSAILPKFIKPNFNTNLKYNRPKDPYETNNIYNNTGDSNFFNPLQSKPNPNKGDVSKSFNSDASERSNKADRNKDKINNPINMNKESKRIIPVNNNYVIDSQSSKDLGTDICKECKCSPNEKGNCSLCGSKNTPLNFKCNKCNNAFCKDCYYKCSNCKECAVKKIKGICKKCKKNFCRKCIFRCSNCTTRLCQSCVNTYISICFNCNKYHCLQCMITCTKSQKNITLDINTFFDFTVWNFKGKHLNFPDISSILSLVKFSSQVTFLSLSKNSNVDDRCSEMLIEAISNHPSLSKVHLYETNIKGETLCNILNTFYTKAPQLKMITTSTVVKSYIKSGRIGGYKNIVLASEGEMSDSYKDEIAVGQGHNVFVIKRS